MKGYYDFNFYNRILQNNKMNNSFKYFSKLRNAVLVRWQTKIAAAWRWKKVLDRIKDRENTRKRQLILHEKLSTAKKSKNEK